MLSDGRLQFTVAWLQSLYGLIGTKQMLTTAYHPHTTGQIDRINKTLPSPQAAGEPSVIRRLGPGEFADNNAKSKWSLMSPPSSHAMARMHSLGAFKGAAW